MKRYHFVTAILTLSISINVWADNCDSVCWQKRYYAMQQQQLLSQRNRYNSVLKENKLLKEENQKLKKVQAERDKTKYRQSKLNEIHERCVHEDMNQASFEEKSLCSVVNSHFAYGSAVPDEMLGLK